MIYSQRPEVCRYCSMLAGKEVKTLHFGQYFPNHCIRHEKLPQVVNDKCVEKIMRELEQERA